MQFEFITVLAWSESFTAPILQVMVILKQRYFTQQLVESGLICNIQDASNIRRLNTMVMLTAWRIWCGRNGRDFKNGYKPTQ